MQERLAHEWHTLTWSVEGRLREPSRSGAAPVVVLGSPRSGTSWLQEVLSWDPAILRVFEPLRPSMDRRVRRALPQWSLPWGDPALERTDVAEPLAEILRDVLAGRRLTPWSMRGTHRDELRRARRLTVKIVRLNRSAGWFATRFPDVEIVALVRHPCAVVDSMAGFAGDWHSWGPSFFRSFLRGHDELAERFVSVETPPYLWFAAFWAAQTRDLLRATKPEEVELVGYEALVERPAALRALLRSLGFGEPPDLDTVTGIPSLTSRTSDVDPHRWCRTLSSEVRDEILTVVRAFGLEGFDADPQPDMAAVRAQHAANRSTDG